VTTFILRIKEKETRQILQEHDDDDDDDVLKIIDLCYIILYFKEQT